VAGEFEALLTMDRDAEAAPLAPGVNVTLKFADCPAASVTGSEIPDSENSPLLRLADEMFTDAPLAVRIPLRVELDPSSTFPKLRLVGDTAKVPVAVPVPESAMPRDEFDAFDVTDKLPLAAPAAVGVKIASNVTL
jgi:hypothetical protein